MSTDDQGAVLNEEEVGPMGLYVGLSAFDARRLVASHEALRAKLKDAEMRETRWRVDYQCEASLRSSSEAQRDKLKAELAEAVEAKKHLHILYGATIKKLDADLAELKKPKNRGIGDGDIAALFRERDALKSELAEAQWLAVELKTERDVWVQRYHDGFGPLDKITAERDELVKWGREAYREFAAALVGQLEATIVAKMTDNNPRRVLANVTAQQIKSTLDRAPASIREQTPEVTKP